MNFKSDAENKFKDCDRDTLATYCDMWGLEYKPNHGAPHLRKLLLAALNDYHEVLVPGGEHVPTEPIPDVPALDVGELSKLNLRSQGSWQGKRRRITLHRVMEYENTTFPHFFAWGGLHIYVPFGTEVDIPYPVFNILREANTGKRLERKRQVDSEGRIFYKEVWLPQQRFMFTDHGITPGTEQLPEDLRDQIRMMWNASNQFDGYSLAQLRQLCRMLKLPWAEDWKAHDLRNGIKRMIGLGEVSELAAPAARTAAK